MAQTSLMDDWGLRTSRWVGELHPPPANLPIVANIHMLEVNLLRFFQDSIGFMLLKLGDASPSPSLVQKVLLAGTKPSLLCRPKDWGTKGAG